MNRAAGAYRPSVELGRGAFLRKSAGDERGRSFSHATRVAHPRHPGGKRSRLVLPACMAAERLGAILPARTARVPDALAPPLPHRLEWQPLPPASVLDLPGRPRPA